MTMHYAHLSPDVPRHAGKLPMAWTAAPHPRRTLGDRWRQGPFWYSTTWNFTWRRRESKLERLKPETQGGTRPWSVGPRGWLGGSRRLATVRVGAIGVALHGDGTAAGRRKRPKDPIWE
jgi:hypothetical protein